jgi:hypothetical protein
MPEPLALPFGEPPTDHLTPSADLDVVTWKSILFCATVVNWIGSTFVTFVGTSDVTEGPRPPTGLMIAEVWVIECPTPRVIQSSVTRTRL